MSEEQSLCISYFDQILGPNTFYCNEPLEESGNAPDLGRILEFQEQTGTFIFAFRKYQTLNHIFYVDSELARGGKELVMITYIIRAAYFKNEIVDVFKYLDSKIAILEEFADELRNLSEFPRILHTQKSDIIKLELLDKGTREFRHRFLKILEKYQNKIYIKDFPVKSNNISKKIFIFGVRGVGKTTFLKSIEAIQFHNQENTDLPTRIYELVIDNLEILSFDCIERNFRCDQCKNYNNCSNAQAFILILDLTDQQSFIDAKGMFNKIIRKCRELDNEITPLLIIGNKFNGEGKFDIDYINKVFDLEITDKCQIKYKYFPIDIINEQEEIMTALRWLVKHML